MRHRDDCQVWDHGDFEAGNCGCGDDEPDVIAELEDFMRVTEGGRLQEWNDPGGRPGMWVSKDGDDYIPGSVLAELLADAVRRTEEDFEGRLEEVVVAVYGRIEAVERRIGLQETQSGIDGRCLEALQDRVASLEKRPAISTEVIEALANRVAAVEREIAETELRRAKLGSQVFGLRGRLDALESRQQDEDPLLRVNRLVTNIVDMESRQQDEAGDNPLAGDPVSAVAYDEAGEGAEAREFPATIAAARRELAREIVERLRGDDVEGLLWSKRSLADWIEREFVI